MAVTIIQGTDREFVITVLREATGEPFDFTGLTSDAVSMLLQGEDADLTLTLDDNGNASKLEVQSAIAGKIKVILSDTDSALLKKGNTDLEMTIKEGAGPDFLVSKVQLPGALDVKESLFA